MGERRVLIYAIAIAFVVVSGIIYTLNFDEIQGDESLIFDENIEEGINNELSYDNLGEEKLICVQLCGAIKNEGIYNVAEGSRIYEIVTLAGGLTEGAAKDVVNQAREAKDGEMIDFPSKAEVENGTYGGSGGSQLVSLNSASKEQLMTLPGVGESKAESIISYREDNNGFDTIEEIMEVDGIKEAMFEKLEDLITI